MKKVNLKKNLNPFSFFRPSMISLSSLSIIFLFVLSLSSCKKDDMQNTSKKDEHSRKDMVKDSVNMKTDKEMNNMLDKHMSNMMNKMKEMKMSGNTDVDFVNMMVIHHEGAINMARSEIESGKDDKIKSMANNIIKDQQKEIESLQSWLGKNKNKKSTSGNNSMKLMESMNSMMNADMKMAGNTDKDFVTMMISHHKGAIDMANVEVDHGTDAEIKKMAQEIIKKQKAEIDQMEEWLNSKK